MKKIIKSLIIGGVYVWVMFVAQSALAQTPLPTIIDPTPATPAVSAPASAPVTAPATPAVVAPATVPVVVPTQTPTKPVAKPTTSTKAAIDSLSSLTAPGSVVNTSNTTSNSASAGNNANNAQIQQLSVNAKAASEALGRAVTKLASTRGKIATRIDSAKKKGIADTALVDVKAKLATADNRIADSRNAADNLAIVPVSKGDTVSIISALQAMDMAAKASIRQAQDALKTTLDALIAVEANIKK